MGELGMSKYTNQQLQEMAREFYRQWFQDDSRCDELLKRLSAQTGLTETQCLVKIQALASGVFA